MATTVCCEESRLQRMLSNGAGMRLPQAGACSGLDAGKPIDGSPGFIPDACVQPAVKFPQNGDPGSASMKDEVSWTGPGRQLREAGRCESLARELVNPETIGPEIGDQ